MNAIRRIFPRFAEMLATLHFRTYVGDGLITRHSAKFLSDQRFLAAYQKGKETGSWGRCDPSWRVYTACSAASHAAKLDGDFVECGVNRGGTALTIMEYLNFNSLEKRFYLLDTYCGFPNGSLPAAANRDQYSDCYEQVKRTFAPFRNARIVKGQVPETLPQITSNCISFLSIDMNCAEPEVAAARELWPRICTGGIMLLDDYGGGPAYAPQMMAFDSLALELNFDIFLLPTGQGMVIKG
jgi:hypothetical protein